MQIHKAMAVAFVGALGLPAALYAAEGDALARGEKGAVEVGAPAAAATVAATPTPNIATPEYWPDPSLFDEPVSIHKLLLEAHRDTPVNPALTREAGATVALQPRTGSYPCQTVYAYLPYWENPTPLEWSLITHLACFAVEVNSNGTLGNSHGWPWTSMVNEAHANGVKVHLVATLFDSASIQTLITTPAYKQAFFVNIRNKLLAGNADGLNIDFESGTVWNGGINAFMADLSTYLKSQIPGCEVTIAGPSVNWSNTWNLPGLANACDGVFIMGYAFYGSWSTSSGPNAPLTGGTYNITNTVDVQYAGADPAKLILGVPYYGNHWKTTSSSPRSTVVSFVGSTFFRSDQPNATTYGRQWDTTSQTPWYRYQSSGQWHQVWYDDAQSLGLKYDLALSRGLAGVGMWAAGYDEGRAELWDLLADKVGGCGQQCDFDDDRDVDLADMIQMLFCLRGPDVDYVDGHWCRFFDLDGDGDVDMDDYPACHADYAP